MLTTKDACDRNVTLMFSFCPNENGDNWESTAATFFDCIDLMRVRLFLIEIKD